MPDAARVGDDHTCMSEAPKPHDGGPIDDQDEPNVETNGLGQARGTDPLTCAGAPAYKNFIVTGSGTVEINKLPAARKEDRTMHRPTGEILEGSDSVEIGGPMVGVILGDPDAGAAACAAAAEGRHNGRSLKQSYQNCGLEMCRQIINQVHPGQALDEDTLFESAMNAGYAAKALNSDGTENAAQSGLTSQEQRQSLLGANGVPSTLEDSTMDNLAQAVAEKKGVISSHDMSVLYQPTDKGGHGVLVTGVEYDENGDPKTVYFNDSGAGKCKDSRPADVFESSLLPGSKLNVTKNPIW